MRRGACSPRRRCRRPARVILRPSPGRPAGRSARLCPRRLPPPYAAPRDRPGHLRRARRARFEQLHRGRTAVEDAIRSPGRGGCCFAAPSLPAASLSASDTACCMWPAASCVTPAACACGWRAPGPGGTRWSSASPACGPYPPPESKGCSLASPAYAPTPGFGVAETGGEERAGAPALWPCTRRTPDHTRSSPCRRECVTGTPLRGAAVALVKDRG